MTIIIINPLHNQIQFIKKNGGVFGSGCFRMASMPRVILSGKWHF